MISRILEQYTKEHDLKGLTRKGYRIGRDTRIYLLARQRITNERKRRGGFDLLIRATDTSILVRYVHMRADYIFTTRSTI